MTSVSTPWDAGCYIPRAPFLHPDLKIDSTDNYPTEDDQEVKLCTEAPWPRTPAGRTFASQLTKLFLSGEARPEATYSASQPIDPMPKQPKTPKPLKPRPITTQRVNERLAELAKATVDTLNSHDTRINNLGKLAVRHQEERLELQQSVLDARSYTRRVDSEVVLLQQGARLHTRSITLLKIKVSVLAGIVACLTYAIVFCV